MWARVGQSAGEAGRMRRGGRGVGAIIGEGGKQGQGCTWSREARVDAAGWRGSEAVGRGESAG